MTQREVAEGAGLAINTVAGLYHDRVKRIDFETLDKLCLFLGVSVGEIIFHEEMDGDGSKQGQDD
jgi:putative transcriptional regulator